MQWHRLSISFMFLALIGFPLLVSGHGYELGMIKIIHPWAMLTASPMQGGASGMGFLVLRNIGHKADQLLMVSTAIAKKVELHHIKSGHPVMQPTETISIPTQSEVRLEPGGSHLMLMGLEKLLVEGDHFPVTLHFKRAGKITVDMVVQTKAKESIY